MKTPKTTDNTITINFLTNLGSVGSNSPKIKVPFEESLMKRQGLKFHIIMRYLVVEKMRGSRV